MYCAKRTDLAPDQHGTKYDLQPIKEVVPDDNNSGPSCGPALTGTDGFNAGCGCSHNGKERKRKTGSECGLHLDAVQHTRYN